MLQQMQCLRRAKWIRAMDRMKNSLHMIEHALNMYANDYAIMPAESLYDDARIAKIGSITNKCHIYFIGQTPTIDILAIRKKTQFPLVNEESSIAIDIALYGGKIGHTIEFPIPVGWKFIEDGENPYLKDTGGKKHWIDPIDLLLEISATLQPIEFKVLYIGQAYGKKGERNAIQRLRKHETLQEIALKGKEEGYTLTLILVGVSTNGLITSFNPHAKDVDKTRSSERIGKGLDKLFGTSEAERITLYEAAMIRYFQPYYNKQLKNSFPSTNMKILSDCYEKDMQAIIAEFCVDKFPYRLFSEHREAQIIHIAHFDLHKETDRKSFFQR
jgi:hypothetical protein